MELQVGNNVIQIDDEDAIVTCLHWYDVDGYATRNVGGRYYKLHVVIAERMTGKPVPSDMVVDHEDRDTYNCRRSNLRVVSRSKNSINRSTRSDNTSGYIGVSFDKTKGKWYGHLGYEGQKHRTKNYATAEQAAKARDELARELHGDYARLNDLPD